MKKSILLFFAITFYFHAVIFSQVNEGGRPFSFKTDRLAERVDTRVMPNVDVEKLLKEDQENQGKSIPYRFGKTFEVAYSLTNSGTWSTLPNGDRLWKLSIESKGAYSINLSFDNYLLPEGASLYLYNQKTQKCLGAYTSKNNQTDGGFAVQPLAGDQLTLEYLEPFAEKGNGKLSIDKITHAYKAILQSEAYGFGDSEFCHVNINCLDGANFQDQKKSVVLILAGGGLCSGALINNARQDGRAFVLSADHCFSGSVTSWVYVFNYESPNCSNIEGVTTNTVTGSTLRARNAASDFILVELSSTPPTNFIAYYAGWSKSSIIPSSATGIHHPAGDIKKISKKNNALSLDTWSSNVNDHWRISGWSTGSTQGGSSGSPLFNQNRLIVGQLHGGTSAVCPASSKNSYYGALFASWEGGNTVSTRLKDWLDPDNTGITTLEGAYIGQTPCSSTPNAGTSISSRASACEGNAIQLSLTGNTFGFGISYQWQKSSNGTTWTSIPTATNASQTTTISESTYFRCGVTCTSNTTYSTAVLVTFTTIGCSFNMTPNATTSITACNGTLKDDGGDGVYSNNQESIVTIYPSSSNSIVSLNFLSFVTEANYDRLFIYNGISTSSPVLGSFDGSVSPGIVTSTNATGALTLRFSTDGSVNSSGFSAAISCITSSCASPLLGGTTQSSKTSVCSIESFALSLTGNSVGVGTSFQWQSSPNGTTWNSIVGATNATYSTTQSASSYYRCLTTCSGTSAASSSRLVSIVSSGCQYSMMSNAITSINSCAGTLADNGGLSGVYLSSQNSIMTVNPETPGFKVRLSFTDFNVENNYDYLYLYDGTGTNATLIGTYTGLNSPGIITATTISGAITVRLTSDNSIVSSGFAANISCVGTPCVSPPLGGTIVASSTTSCLGTPITLNLVGSSTGGGLTHQWEESSNNTTWSPLLNQTSNVLTISPLANSYYRCKLTCSGVVGYSTSLFITISTTGCQFVITPNTTSSISACSGTLFDDGGVSNSYTGGQNSILTILPSTPNASVQLTFTSFLLENNFDNLAVYDGTTTSAPLLNTFTGNSQPGLLTASNSNGALTLRFTSDFSVETAGFAALISCQGGSTSVRNASTKLLAVFPNPTTGICTITLSENNNSTSTSTYSIFSTIGESIESGIVENTNGQNTLDLSHLSPGMYSLLVIEGDRSSSIKLVITR